MCVVGTLPSDQHDMEESRTCESDVLHGTVQGPCRQNCFRKTPSEQLLLTRMGQAQTIQWSENVITRYNDYVVVFYSSTKHPRQKIIPANKTTKMGSTFTGLHMTFTHVNHRIRQCFSISSYTDIYR